MNVTWIYGGASPEGFEWKGGDTIHRDTGGLVEATFGEPNYRYIWWLEKALVAAKCVARVRMPSGSATGFLIGPDVFITNNHVFKNEDDAASAKLQFDYRLDADGIPATIDSWECDPDSLFKTNPTLDYSIVQVKEKGGKKVGNERGFLNATLGVTVSPNQRVNIIQHPQGRFQQIAFRDNQVKAVEDEFIQYITDTDYGTSGSPVLDDWFNVVALHAQRVRDPNSPDKWYRNQGYRIEKIIEDAGM